MASQHAILVTDTHEEAYFDDIDSDEFVLPPALLALEEDEFLAASLPANEDFEDIIEISHDWADIQPDDFSSY